MVSWCKLSILHKSSFFLVSFFLPSIKNYRHCRGLKGFSKTEATLANYRHIALLSPLNSFCVLSFWRSLKMTILPQCQFINLHCCQKFSPSSSKGAITGHCNTYKCFHLFCSWGHIIWWKWLYRKVRKLFYLCFWSQIFPEQSVCFSLDCCWLTDGSWCAFYSVLLPHIMTNM